MKAQNTPQEVRELYKLLDSFQYKHDISTVFADFLTVVTCCYAWQTKEPEYLETIKRYSKDELTTLCKMLAELTKLYGQNVTVDTWFDPLGIIYETIASNWKKSRMGQFFTPDAVCTLMAEFTVPEMAEETYHLNDCCVGSGRLPLAASRKNSNILVFGEDKDPLCCKMAAVNLMFHGVRAQVVNVDSLALDKYYKGYVVNWNMKESGVFSCLDLPESKSYTWQMWQQRAKVETAKKAIVQQEIKFFM